MSATDVGGLAEGMSKVASSADLVGKHYMPKCMVTYSYPLYKLAVTT